MARQSKVSISAVVGTAIVAVTATSSVAVAGGFAIREQSAHFQGSSFAGNAAGGALSSMFWNPAAVGQVGAGITTESAYSLIITDSEMTALPGTTLLPVPGGTASTNSGKSAVVPASYGAYRLSSDLAVGIAITAPFGLGSEPDADNWAGRVHQRSSKLTTYNATPTLGYRVAPGITIGAGVQMEYAKLVFKFADGAGAFAPNAGLNIEDRMAFGYTAGIMLQPARGTSIGLGFRSSISHEFEGSAFDNGNPANWANVKATLETPETVTLSLRQDLAHNLRGLATVEWSNWSRFDSIPIECKGQGTGNALFTCASGTFATLDANWHDGWFYSVGLEYDYSPALTLRTGIAYEKSPIQNPEERLPQVPDSDRVWLSGGLSYAMSASTTLDFAYTHIFVEDATINRAALTSPARLVADREASVDIVTVGLKYRWGGAPEPLK